ncbi:MAG: nucleotidyltransferase [Campylobacterota bacterium]|nr:nucleotidyltransferase [Campylobacterota bacterium]
MAYTVQDSFNEFVQNISISCDLSNIAEDRTKLMVDLLDKKFEILEIFPVGSLLTYTAIKDHTEIDIMLVLHYSKYIKNKAPIDLLQKVKKTLSSYHTKITKKNTHAIKFNFQTPPNVNIIPASRVSDNNLFSHYNIPSTDKDIWIASNPKIHTQNMRELSVYKSQLIQIIKEWNRHNGSYLTSFHIDNIALLYEDEVNSDLAWHVCKFFKHMLEVLENPIHNPNGLGSNADDYLDNYSRTEIIKIIDDTITLTYNAWYEVYSDKDQKISIEIYRECFGERFPKYG